MRIASLVPSATEALFALGLGDRVVAVTHECDYPSPAAQLPSLTRSVLPEGLSAAAIDAAVREHTSRGEAIYKLDEERLRSARPDLIVTQAVCEVCAVSCDDVRAVAARLDPPPRVLSLDPTTLGEVLADLRRLAKAAGADEAGERLVGEAAERIDVVRRAVSGEPAVAAVCLEWLDPPYAPGHWVPQMVELAGGEERLGRAGERSRVADWGELEAARPELAIAMPCGYGSARAAEEALAHARRLSRLGARRIIAVDASAYFSRPGPRLVDGIELLAHLFHPGSVADPPPGRFVELEASTFA